MSLLSSFIIDPVARHVRRLSGVQNAPPPAEASIDGALPLTCDNPIYPPHASLDREPNEKTAQINQDTAASTVRRDTFFGRFRRYSSFSRSPQDAVEEEEGDGTSSAPPTASIAIPLEPSMPSSLSRALGNPPPRTSSDTSVSTSIAPATAPISFSRPALVSRNATTASESLPADDGMAHLRARIHEIRDLEITDQERARMIHGLMTERYNLIRPTSPVSITSHDRPYTPASGHSIFSEIQPSSPISTASDTDPENPYNLRPGDTVPVYRLKNPAEQGEDDEDDSVEGEPDLGCQHYKRNVKVQCHQCRRWYTCRHCHDAVEDHNLNRKMTQNMLCMACGTPQQAADHCENCQIEAACYYCDICKLWDNNNKKKIYHCPDCGICRRGEGLGKDFYHCKNCNVCLPMSNATAHKCRPGAMDNDCPICGEYLFTSSIAVVSMPCGHYLHKGCYNLYMETAYKCPICKKSAVSMDLQWRKLTHAIESQPMPEQFVNTRAIVQCNDCSAKSSVKYHWLGNQCGTCDSYNTNELRILNGPESEETANAILDAEAEAGSRTPFTPSSPTSQFLLPPRYYFQPDQPEQTWLPAQLPAFPFQMPQFPGRPRLPQMPQMPQFPSLSHFPQFPQMPQFPQIYRLPQMPQMPDAAQELLERVRKSMDAYLNPTGAVRVEDVPFIDLVDDDRRERQATDGTTVLEPSLPQYVVERFTQSLQRFRDDLNPGWDDPPELDISENKTGETPSSRAGTSRHLRQSSLRDDERDEDESSCDESNTGDEDEDDEESGEDVDGRGTEFDLPGHR